MCRRNFEGALNRLQLNPLKRRVKPLKFDFILKSLIGACHLGIMTQKFPVKKDETAFNRVSLQGSESELNEYLESDFAVNFNKRGRHLVHHANEGLAILAVPYCFNKDQGLLIENSMRYFSVYNLCQFFYHFIFGNEFVVLCLLLESDMRNVALHSIKN